MGLLDELTGEPTMNPRTYLTRRSAALILLGTATTATALPRVLSAASRPESDASDSSGSSGSFDEVHLGRRISGRRQPGEDGAWHVTVDGRPLHLMRRADGSYLSMVDHYDAYDGPLAAARGAVAELGGQALRPHPRKA
ncbi:tyrosinase family oxidase copper chaperone [Streptomyces sp. NPDC016845]|uniref:tyrosinase family oxidase copper chaperone n=1 Tax=Streptomyces sp. NPDC016845 TaxID=3364972 RepID=UPI0037B8513C